MTTKNTLQLIAALTVSTLASCATSLSNPNGSGHSADLDLYELTGQNSKREVTEADIAAARSGGGRVGTLPIKGAKILLVQSGAHQPDAELQEAYQPFGQIVLWNGTAEQDNSNRYDSDKKEKEKPNAGSVGRRLRLVAAQQGCSHVIVVFGEIQSESKDLPTSAVSWVPVVGDLVPTKRSGTRLLAQAIILETGSTRYTTITAAPKQSTGITTEDGDNTVNGRRALKLKAAAYPELARQSFR